MGPPAAVVFQSSPRRGTAGKQKGRKGKQTNLAHTGTYLNRGLHGAPTHPPTGTQQLLKLPHGKRKPWHTHTHALTYAY